jgi:hypothetical protein
MTFTKYTVYAQSSDKLCTITSLFRASIKNYSHLQFLSVTISPTQTQTMPIQIFAPAPAAPAITRSRDNDSDDEMDLDTTTDHAARPSKNIITPGEVITSDPQWMRGHGTYTNDTADLLPSSAPHSPAPSKRPTNCSQWFLCAHATHQKLEIWLSVALLRCKVEGGRLMLLAH